MEAGRDKSLEFRIPADRRYVSVVRRGVRNLAESAGFAREDVADVEVAVAEAVTNSVEHGTPEPQLTILVKCHTADDRLVVEIEDHSLAGSILDAGRTSSVTDERGRGVRMMQTLMDECSDYRTDHGIGVRMAKHRVRSSA